MRNLLVSCYKLLMLLIVVLTIFYSCTADEDLLLESVNQDSIEELNTIDQGSSKTSSSDPIPLNQNDTTDVTDKPSNVPIALATPSSGVPPLEVTFSVSNSLSDKVFSKYEWKFKDGTKTSSSKPVRTFKEVGKHEVELTATDEEGQILIDSVTVTVIKSEDELPIAVATASSSSGSAPLDIVFTGSDSTDDNAVTDYYWDFKDGSSSTEADPSHTFDTPGTYVVELSVGDENEQTNKDTITITVNAPQNEAPKAVATPSTVNGDAPLQVDFTGSNSSDDKEVVDYSWDFQGGSSTSANTTHTFDNPGVYNIALTVTDDEGLRDTATLTVTVNQPPTGNTGGGQIPCSVGGGKAGETGAKIWCWDNVNVPAGGPGDYGFSDGQLGLAIECNPNQVTGVDNRLRFYLNPTIAPQSWCGNSFNMRAEIGTSPWGVNHPIGTEEWFGYSYTFGDGYLADSVNDWLFFQVHEGTVGESPLLSLTVSTGNSSLSKGEIVAANASQSGPNNSYYPSNVVPVAGETVDVVMHIIWGDDTNGLWEIWLNGNRIHSLQARTIRASNPVGGNAKFGIYKHGWRNASNVQSSANQGITDLETFMGPLRMITRRPGNVDYGKDSYNEVAP